MPPLRGLCVISAVDFVLGGKNQPLLKMYDQWRGWADPKVCCDYSFHVGVTWWSDLVHQEMETLVKEKGLCQVCTAVSANIYSPCAGVNSFKMFLAYKDIFMLRDDEVDRFSQLFDVRMTFDLSCCS